MSFDYDNKDLLNDVIVSMKGLAWNIDEQSIATECGYLKPKVISMPAEVVTMLDEEGNAIAGELCTLVEVKTPKYTIIYKLSCDSWYDNDKPPKEVSNESKG